MSQRQKISLSLRTTPVPPPTASSAGEHLFRRVALPWRLLIASLAVDPLLYQLHIDFFTPAAAFQVAVACCLVIIPFLSQRRFHSYVGSLRSAQKRAVGSDKGILLYMGIGGALLAGASKVFLAAQLPLLPAIVFTTILLIVAFQTGRKILRDFESERARFRDAPFAQVKSWEDQLVILQIAPMIIARAVGIIGAVQVFPREITGAVAPVWNTTSLEQLLPFSLLSLILLGLLMPQRALFRAFCPKCKQPVPLVMTSLGSCLRCDPDLHRNSTEKSASPLKKR